MSSGSDSEPSHHSSSSEVEEEEESRELNLLGLLVADIDGVQVEEEEEEEGEFYEEEGPETSSSEDEGKIQDKSEAKMELVVADVGEDESDSCDASVEADDSHTALAAESSSLVCGDAKSSGCRKSEHTLSSRLFSLWFQTGGYAVEVLFSMIFYSTLPIFVHDILVFSFLAVDFDARSLFMLISTIFPVVITWITCSFVPDFFLCGYNFERRRGGKTDCAACLVFGPFVLRVVVVGLMGFFAGVFLVGLPGYVGSTVRSLLEALVLVLATAWAEIRLAGVGVGVSTGVKKGPNGEDQGSKVELSSIRDRFVAAQPMAWFILCVVRFVGWSRWPNEIALETEGLPVVWILACVGMAIVVLLATIMYVLEEYLLTFVFVGSRTANSEQSKKESVEVELPDPPGEATALRPDAGSEVVKEEKMELDLSLPSVDQENACCEFDCCSCFSTTRVDSSHEEAEVEEAASARDSDSDSTSCFPCAPPAFFSYCSAFVGMILWGFTFAIMMFWIHHFVISPITVVRWSSGGEFGDVSEKSTAFLIPYVGSGALVVVVALAIVVVLWDRLSWLIFPPWTTSIMLIVFGTIFTFSTNSIVLMTSGVVFVVAIVFSAAVLLQEAPGGFRFLKKDGSGTRFRYFVGGVSFAMFVYIFVVFSQAAATLKSYLPLFGDLFGSREYLFRMLCIYVVALILMPLILVLNRWPSSRTWNDIIWQIVDPLHWKRGSGECDKSEHYCCVKNSQQPILAPVTISRCFCIVVFLLIFGAFAVIFLLATNGASPMATLTDLTLEDIDPTVSGLPNASMPVFRVVTFNVQLGVSTNGVTSWNRLAEFLSGLDFGYAGLQEMNTGGGGQGGFTSLTDFLARKTGAVSTQIRDRDAQSMGSSALVRTDVSDCLAFALDSRVELLQSTVRCSLNIPRWNGTSASGLPPLPIDVFSVHLDEIDYGTSQIDQLNQILTEYVRPGVPTIILGDFNIYSPDNPAPNANYYVLGNHSFVNSYYELYQEWTPTDPSEGCIDYVFYRGMGFLHPLRGEVVASDLSDHYAVVIDFKVD